MLQDSFIVLHPYYKLDYIKMSRGGAEEQNIERMGGNPDAKNWQDEALKMVEKAVSVAFLPRFPSIIEQQIDEYVLQTATES